LMPGKVQIPKGEKITIDHGKLRVPDNPIIAFVEGDGTGPDIWRASVRVLDAAVEQSYKGKKKIAWAEVYAGEKAQAVYGKDCPPNLLPDETIDVIVRAYERLNSEKPIRPLNWTIMHLFHPSDAALKKMAALGIAATMQDHPVLLGHNQRRWWGDEHAAYAIPIRKTIDAGVLVGGGTDGPVVPVDPFLSMWWMTTRQVLKGYALGKEHAITSKEALTLYTINNARIMGVERERGSIEVGKLADLAVLSQDVLSVAPDAIRDTKALMTVLGGKIVYRNGL